MTQATTGYEESRYLLRRVAARLFDSGLLLLIVLVGQRVARAYGLTADQAALVGQVLGVWSLFLYETALTGRWGTTIGKQLAGIRVVDRDGDRPGAAAAARRALPVLFLVVPLLWLVSLTSWLSAALSADGRGVHDRLAGTWVALAHRRPDAVSR